MTQNTNSTGRLDQACFMWVGKGQKTPVPARKSPDAAAFDVCTAQSVGLNPGDCELVSTGWAVRPPHGYAGFLLPRSGLGNDGLVLGNLTGLIDPDYRGELKVSLWNRNPPGGEAFTFLPGERVAQLIFLPFSRCEGIEVLSLDATARGDGGFGSTGHR